MYRLVIITWLVAIIAGCAAAGKMVALDPSDSTQLKGKSLVIVKRKSPGFVALTSKKGMFAILGVGAAISAGNKLVEDKQIIDPALKINQSVARKLRSRYGMTIAGTTKQVAADEDLQSIIALSAGKNYVLDVATLGWSFIYDGFNFSDYLVGYSAKLRLIDAKNARVLSEGLCVYDWEKAGKTTVSYDALMANDAAVIKQHMSESVKYCTDFYTSTLFNS